MKVFVLFYVLCVFVLFYLLCVFVLFYVLCVFVLFYVLCVFMLFYVLCVFVLFYVLFVCKCVLYHCHRVLTKLQLTNISIKFSEKFWTDLMEQCFRFRSYTLLSATKFWSPKIKTR